MVDTVRTLAELQTIFADGQAAGSITPQDARDGWVSADAWTKPIVTANLQTANYTAVLGDAGDVVEMNLAGANTFTVPPNASVAFPIGTIIEVCQYGAGTTTLTPGAAVTLRSASTLALRTQYSTAALRKRATDEWVVSGDVT